MPKLSDIFTKLLISFLLALLLLVLGCSAPHDNPLDPDSDRYREPEPEPQIPAMSARVWSEHVSYNFPSTDIYQIRVEFRDLDSTAEFDSVWVTYDGSPPLPLSTPNGVWGRVFQWSYFGCGQLMDCVIGQPFSMDARTIDDDIYSIGPMYIYRVVSGTPATSEPDSNDIVSPHVILEWPQFSANFPFGYQAAVYWIDSSRTVWTSALLPREQRVVDVFDSLANGNYLWTLTVADSFGNTSRSKEALFSVLAGSGL